MLHVTCLHLPWEEGAGRSIPGQRAQSPSIASCNSWSSTVLKKKKGSGVPMLFHHFFMLSVCLLFVTHLNWVVSCLGQQCSSCPLIICCSGPVLRRLSCRHFRHIRWHFWDVGCKIEMFHWDRHVFTAGNPCFCFVLWSEGASVCLRFLVIFQHKQLILFLLNHSVSTNVHLWVMA